MSEPVVIRACVEQMSATVEDMEIERVEWDAMTPAQRREMIEDFGATTMNNAGGYGASLLSGAPDSDLDDEPTKRTFEVPAEPDDVKQVRDAEGALWERGKTMWVEGEHGERVDWRALVTEYGPLTEI